MSVNLEIPRKLEAFIEQAHQVAVHVFRPISRKYDTAEHTYPVELDMLASVMDGLTDGGATRRCRRASLAQRQSRRRREEGAQRRQHGDRARLHRALLG